MCGHATAPKPGRTTSIRIWGPSTTSTHGIQMLDF